MRLAVWSGPRNLSTAMMYAFAQRSDCVVWDEPFYAPYLAVTGIDHPMRAQVLEAHEADPGKVAAACAGPIPDGKSLWYQKHMPHHMVDGLPLDWAEEHTHVHLIRHPARVIASYRIKRENPTLDDLGFARQVEIFQRFGGIVIDSDTVLENPEAALWGLCDAIGITFEPAMLSWSTGPKPYDGVWAKHWYDGVHRSSGLTAGVPKMPDVDPEDVLLRNALPLYDALRASASTVSAQGSPA